MNIQAIQMVVCVAEELSFSRAAEKLFVSQPAISKQIQQMERELGVALFKRARHQVELTPAGAACLPLFQQMKRDYERVQRIARRFDTDVQGSVGIAYPNVTTLSLMSQTLSALREKFPLLHAQPVKMPALQLLQSLDDGTASMAIVFHEMIRNRTDLAYVLLRRGRMSALVPKTHELASRPYLDYATLRSYPLILHEMSANQLEMTGMLAELSAHGIDYHTCRREKRAEDILLHAAMDEGIGLMPDGFLCFQVEPLVALPVIDSSLENDVVLAWPAADTTPAIKAIVQLVEQRHAPQK